MQHVASKALTHAGNNRHGNGGHNQGRGRTPKGADLDVFGRVMVNSLKLDLYWGPQPVMADIH